MHDERTHAVAACFATEFSSTTVCMTGLPNMFAQMPTDVHDDAAQSTEMPSERSCFEYIPVELAKHVANSYARQL